MYPPRDQNLRSLRGQKEKGSGGGGVWGGGGVGGGLVGGGGVVSGGSRQAHKVPKTIIKQARGTLN